MGSIGVTVQTADIVEIRGTLLNNGLVKGIAIGENLSEEVYSFSSSAISDSPTAAIVSVLRAVTDLQEGILNTCVVSPQLT